VLGGLSKGDAESGLGIRVWKVNHTAGETATFKSLLFPSLLRDTTSVHMAYAGTRLYRSIELADYRDASGRSVGVVTMDCLIGNHGRLHMPLEKAWDAGGLLCS
jgi:hypothetical protein